MIDVIILIAFVFMGFVILSLGIWHIELKNDNEALQVENSDLIERNQKLDTYLDEARAESVKANHKLMKLEYTESVWVVVHKETGTLYGCFRTEPEAKKYASTSKYALIKHIKIAD